MAEEENGKPQGTKEKSDEDGTSKLDQPVGDLCGEDSGVPESYDLDVRDPFWVGEHEL